MKVLIVEDEFYAFEKLSLMLERLDPNIEILGQATNIKDAVALIKTNEIDLAFFDIQLTDGISFSIFDYIEVKFPVIFTTAYDNHAIRAFKHNSVDYLLKPLRFEELKLAMDKYEQIWKPTSVVSLAESFNLGKVSFKERFTIKVGEHIKMVSTVDISCFYSFDKGTFLFTSEKRNYLIDYSLDDLMGIVDPKEFYRVSRKFIIRFDQIIDIISYSNSRLRIILKSHPDDEIIVSRERVKGFKEWIG